MVALGWTRKTTVHRGADLQTSRFAQTRRSSEAQMAEPSTTHASLLQLVHKIYEWTLNTSLRSLARFCVHNIQLAYRLCTLYMVMALFLCTSATNRFNFHVVDATLVFSKRASRPVRALATAVDLMIVKINQPRLHVVPATATPLPVTQLFRVIIIR